MENINISENCFLLGYYSASNGNSLPIGCLETSVRYYHYSRRSNPEERSSYLLCFGWLNSRIGITFKFQFRPQTT